MRTLSIAINNNTEKKTTRSRNVNYGHTPEAGHTCKKCGTDDLICTIEDGACDFFERPYCLWCSESKAYEDVQRQMDREDLYSY